MSCAFYRIILSFCWNNFSFRVIKYCWQGKTALRIAQKAAKGKFLCKSFSQTIFSSVFAQELPPQFKVEPLWWHFRYLHNNSAILWWNEICITCRREDLQVCCFGLKSQVPVPSHPPVLLSDPKLHLNTSSVLSFSFPPILQVISTYESFFQWLHIKGSALTNTKDGQRFCAPLLFLVANACPLGESSCFLDHWVIGD